MSIVKVHLTHNYSTFSNEIFADGHLSFQAMGMLAYLLSKPANWSINIEHLANVTQGTAKKTGKEGVYNILKELKAAGYVRTQKLASGKILYTVLTVLIAISLMRQTPIR